LSSKLTAIVIDGDDDMLVAVVADILFLSIQLAVSAKSATLNGNEHRGGGKTTRVRLKNAGGDVKFDRYV
jgi:hypothetical protein